MHQTHLAGRPLGLALLGFTLALLCGCAGEARHGASQTGSSAGAGSMSLRVMSFNIEWGGANVRFESVVDAIRESGADIVGVQEAEGNLERLATDLGWHREERSYIVSRYRVIDPPGSEGRYAFVEVRPGEAVAIANVHLPSDPYGPDWVKEGRPAGEVLDLEKRLRLPKIEPYLEVLPDLFGTGMPVFLTGDFNAPSHADWTSTVVGTRPFVAYPLDWPVSRAVAGAGFRDSFREAHPDPVRRPGLTWWAKRQRIRDYNPGPGETEDRIDLVWYAGPASVTGSQIVGEKGGRGVSIAVEPWPSDHRGVVSSFDAVPAPLPTLVAADKRVYRSDESIRIDHRGPGREGGSIGIAETPRDGPGRRRKTLRIDAGQDFIELPRGSLAPGRYRAQLVDASGKSLSTSNPFWVLDRDAVPSLEVVGTSFGAGEAIELRWRNGPGLRNDWLAAFSAGAAPDAQDFAAYAYVGAESSGALRLDAASAEDGWPLPPGRYVVRMLKDDGMDLLAESQPFTVE